MLVEDLLRLGREGVLQGGEDSGFGCLAGLLVLAGSFPFLVALPGSAEPAKLGLKRKMRLLRTTCNLWVSDHLGGMLLSETINDGSVLLGQQKGPIFVLWIADDRSKHALRCLRALPIA